MSTTSNALLAIGYGPLSVPPGSVVDHILVTASGAATGPQPSQSVAPGVPTVTFAGLAPDTYTFSAQAFPASGVGYGTPAAVNLVVVPPVTSVTIQVPSTLSASQP